MFKVLSTQQIGGQFRPYYETIAAASQPLPPLDYHDLATYADCPARLRARSRSLDDHLDILDHIVELAAADPEGFAKTYGVPPATLQTAENVCPGCGSVGTGQRCSKCGVTRRPRQVTRAFSPVSAAGKVWKAEMQRRGKFPLTASRAERVTGAANALHRDKAVSAAADGAIRLLAIAAQWTPDTGGPALPVRAVVSLLPRDWSDGDGTVVALMTCQSAHPVAFAVIGLRRALHVRAALELDLLNETSLGPRSKYLIAAAEFEPPHVVARRVITPDQIAAGREIYQQALSNIALSLKQGYWPDYDTAGPDKPGWTEVDPEGALHNQARALLGGPLLPADPTNDGSQTPPALAA